MRTRAAPLIRFLVIAVAIVLAALTQGADAAYSLLKSAAFYITVLSVIVFIHEFGHYIIAKWAGVRIETFSIGFGKEMLGWNDRTGTRWKISMLPFGGYVKMFGDASEASNPSSELHNLSEEDKKYTFHHKALYKKAAIVAAGPFFNFILAIVIFTGFIYTRGMDSTEPVVGTVLKDSAAEHAGFKPGDRILNVDGVHVTVFSDIPAALLTNLGTPVNIVMERDGKQDTITVTPKMITEPGPFGNEVTHAQIGLASVKFTLQTVGPAGALWAATKVTYNFCTTTLKAVGQILTGERSASKNIKGPVSMGKMAGAAAAKGLPTMLYFIAILSANLGLVNLFPIPVLDGGHLLIYLIQAVTRRPMNEKLQEYSFRVGMALISMLMAFAVINDFWPGIFK